jgi:hypothetical protein
MKPQVVSFHCVMSNVLGHVLGTTFSHGVITDLPDSEASQLPGLPAGMKNVKACERRKITLKAAEAYRFYSHELVSLIFELPYPKSH